MEARVYELFTLCFDVVRQSCQGNFGAGVVLSGNGIATMDGSVQIANEIFGMPVRIASSKVKGLSGLQYCTAAGIISYICKQEKEAKYHKLCT